MPSSARKKNHHHGRRQRTDDRGVGEARYARPPPHPGSGAPGAVDEAANPSVRKTALCSGTRRACRSVARSDGVARAAPTRPDSHVWAQQRRFGHAQWETLAEPASELSYCVVLRRATVYSMTKQTMTIRIEPEVRSALDALATAAERDRTWIVNQALTAYIETQCWQIEHIRQGLREADAGKFAAARAVKQVVDRLRRK